MPHDPHLAERIRAALKRRHGVTEKRMFGGYCWMLRGNMLCGVEVGRYMFRVGRSLKAKPCAVQVRVPWISLASRCAGSCGSVRILPKARRCRRAR